VELESPTPYEVALISAESERWRTFAEEHATSPLQLPSWLDTLTDAYRLRAQIVALTGSDGSVLASLPMIRSKLPWRKRWTSLPFTDTLEPVAIDRGHRDALLVAIAEQAGVGPLIVRTRAALPGWSDRQVGTVQTIDLSEGAEGVLRGAHAHHRRSVKRALRPDGGLVARPIEDRSEFLGASLALMARSRGRLGAPTQPSRYWSRLWQLHERGDALTIGVYLGRRLVANGVFIVGRNHAVYKYGASDPATRQLRTSFLMFVTAYDRLASRGARSMDFGITDLHNSSLREFKSRWGGEEQPAHFSATDEALLPTTIEPGRILTKAIQHTPVFVGRTVGSLAYPFVA
jgi:CelD/BcsL family acetyltransferase involved in cellulose biosynthesis